MSSNDSLAGLIDQLVCLRIEEFRCMEKFKDSHGDDKKAWYQSAKECRGELVKVQVKINAMQQGERTV